MENMTVVDAAEMAGPTKEELGFQLAHLLSDNVTAKFLAHGYHWNVMGPEFSQMHEFFAGIYGTFDEAIDPIAEYLLKNGYDAPYLLTDFTEITCIHAERIEGGDARAMTLSLITIAETLKVEAVKLFDIADELDAQDIANFAADLLDGYNKMLWQLKATINVR